MSASVRPEPISGMSGLSFSRYGHGADVVLVAVREHDADDVVEPVLDRLEVGQDQVDAGLVLLGEQHAAVDDEELAAVLEDGHVAADLAEAAERGDAEGSGVEGGRVVDGAGHQSPSSGCRGIRSRVRARSAGARVASSCGS